MLKYIGPYPQKNNEFIKQSKIFHDSYKKEKNKRPWIIVWLDLAFKTPFFHYHIQQFFILKTSSDNKWDYRFVNIPFLSYNINISPTKIIRYFRIVGSLQGNTKKPLLAHLPYTGAGTEYIWSVFKSQHYNYTLPYIPEYNYERERNEDDCQPIIYHV
jgi:hypothetical protein